MSFHFSQPPSTWLFKFKVALVAPKPSVSERRLNPMRASGVHAACSPHPRRPRLCRRPRGHEAAEAVSALRSLGSLPPALSPLSPPLAFPQGSGGLHASTPPPMHPEHGPTCHRCTEPTSSEVLCSPEETSSSPGDTFIILGLNREVRQGRGTPSLQRRKNSDTTGRFSARAPAVALERQTAHTGLRGDHFREQLAPVASWGRCSDWLT